MHVVTPFLIAVATLASLASAAEEIVPAYPSANPGANPFGISAGYTLLSEDPASSSYTATYTINSTRSDVLGSLVRVQVPLDPGQLIAEVDAPWRMVGVSAESSSDDGGQQWFGFEPTVLLSGQSVVIHIKRATYDQSRASNASTSTSGASPQALLTFAVADAPTSATLQSTDGPVVPAPAQMPKVQRAFFALELRSEVDAPGNATNAAGNSTLPGAPSRVTVPPPPPPVDLDRSSAGNETARAMGPSSAQTVGNVAAGSIGFGMMVVGGVALVEWSRRRAVRRANLRFDL